MTVEKLFNSFYLVPVILDYFDNPSEITRKILDSNGITNEDLIKIHKVRNLLKYHYSVVTNDFKHSDYALLKVGLAEYWEEYISGLFYDLGFQDKEMNILDYGAGDGQVAKKFIDLNPKSKAILVDREFSKYIDDIRLRYWIYDFEANRGWYLTSLINELDMVILSEVLHCKTLDIQDYLITSSRIMLKSGGYLLIIENIDYCMAYRIGKLKNQKVDIVDGLAITRLMHKQDFDYIDAKKYQNHIAYLFKKR